MKALVYFFFLGLLLSCEKVKFSYNDFTAEEIKLINAGGTNDTMRVLNYFVPQDSMILRSKSENVFDFSSPTLKLLISRMYATVISPAHPGVGIAAPQVGIKKRIIWVKRYDKQGKPFEVYLNPRILKYSDTLKQRPDGCLSIPGVSGTSWRAIWVEVEYYTQDGQKHVEKITHEYTAHIFQHEIDHLDGILWIDRRNKP